MKNSSTTQRSVLSKKNNKNTQEYLVFSTYVFVFVRTFNELSGGNCNISLCLYLLFNKRKFSLKCDKSTFIIFIWKSRAQSHFWNPSLSHTHFFIVGCHLSSSFNSNTLIYFYKFIRLATFRNEITCLYRWDIFHVDKLFFEQKAPRIINSLQIIRKKYIIC